MQRTLKSSTQVRSVIFAIFLSIPITGGVFGDSTDWPQWNGPLRDGHAAEQKLLEKWPEGGPKLLWTFKNAGAGYSASSIADGKLFSIGATEKDCNVFCLDAKTGEQLWSQRIDRASVDGDYLHGWGGGPRSAPTVHNGKVYALSDLGTLAVLDAKSGKVDWSVNLVSDFGGKVPKWGYSESPLIDGDRVIVTPGGKNFLIGLDLKNGKQNFSSESMDVPAHYVSVVKGNFQGKPVYVTASQPGLFGIDAVSGKKLFENAASGNPTAVIPTPIVKGDLVYHTSAYGAGNVLVRIEADGAGMAAKQIYHEKAKSMENHHGGVVLLDGVIYGFSKADGGVWMAQDLESGKVLWSQKVGRNASGSIALADGLLYCYSDKEGKCILAAPNRTGWKPLGEFALPEQTSSDRGKGAIWAHPVIANQKLFIRDQELIYAYDIAN
jgi:outer membrane protein assembly factor BamB